MPVLRKFQSNSDPNTADGRPDIMLIVTSNEDGNEVQATTRPIEVKKKDCIRSCSRATVLIEAGKHLKLQ